MPGNVFPFPALAGDIGKVLEALGTVFPVPASRRADLPAAVRDLSRILTTERGDMARSYWRTPRLTAAYLYYFLPWNICRLAHLPAGQDLGLGPGARILDAGSGPLTLPLALWCTRPDMRSLPLEFVCADTAPHPLELGRDIFRALTGGESPWRISTERASLDRMLLPRGRRSYSLIAALNVLNELCGERGRRDAERMGDDLENLAVAAAGRLAPGGRLLVLEPGTRLGGRIVALLRKDAPARGYRILAPCTHHAPCPMFRRSCTEPDAARPRNAKAGAGPRFSGWCHFTCAAGGAPDGLLDLAKQAGLQKKRLSFSFLFMEKTADGPPAPPEKDAGERNTLLRVLSDPITLPGKAGAARYACSGKGPALLADAEYIPSGALVRASVRRDAAGRVERDAKTALPVYDAVHENSVKGAYFLRKNTCPAPMRFQF
jgi:hypothetical protein